MYHKRITVRNGLIDDSSRMLDRRNRFASESNHRQNVWTVMEESIHFYPARQKYYNGLSSLGLTRLYNAIAKQAAVLSGTYRPAKLTASQFNRKSRMFDYLNKL